MKTKIFATTLLMIATTVTSTFTLASPWEGHSHAPEVRHSDQMQRHQVSRPDRTERNHNEHRPEFRSASHQDKWQQGEKLPRNYRGSHYRVNNWKAHDLPSPPRGQRWVNVNGDYILVAIATGVITNILMNH